MKLIIRQSKTGVFFSTLLLLGLFVFSSSFTIIGSQAQADLLQKEMQRLNEISQKGGWQKITLGKSRYQKGESANAIVQVKKRLKLSGDYTAKDLSPLYTEELERAVKRVQRRFGFPQNGVIEASLVLALNVPVEERLAQLQANLDRLLTEPDLQDGNRIVVNIPEYKLHVYEGSNEVLSMNVVVGKESSPTELFNDELTHIVFSPYWNVPPDIVENEILPAMQKRRNYLSAHGYEITGRENGLPVIRQRPGKNNSLGQVKFLFPNPYNIYFHDTPAKSLFKNRIRAYSHGCIRLEEPQKLAEYLLRNNPEWTPFKISEAMDAGKEQWVKLPVAVPVSIVYYTAWIDEEGLLNFRDDIYGYDRGIPVTGTFSQTQSGK
jgi:murein L,D-transpeptidase YcbB/YkuD